MTKPLPVALLLALVCKSALALLEITADQFASTIPSRFIVEYHHPGILPRDTSVHDYVLGSLTKQGVHFHVNKKFDTQGLFLGAAVTLTKPDDLKALQDTPGVAAVHPVQIVPAPEPVKSKIVYSPSDPAITKDVQATHVITGVDRLHAEGITGLGIKIGIIDTGTDYRHPALGGGYGSGFKVAGGHDFVGDNYTGIEEPKPDDDPLDCAGHGTHVAGIAAADPNNDFNVTGVASSATIYSYRIFGCRGGTGTDVIIDALLRAYNDGMDVITMSLGGTDGWTTSPQAVVASRIAARGKIVTVAAGNEGAAGAWFTSSPGDGIGVISVGSTDNTARYISNATLRGADRPSIAYDSFLPIPLNGTFQLYATSFNLTDDYDACDPLPPSTPNLTNAVALIRRGTCSFANKSDHAAAFGAKWTLIDNNVPGLTPIDTLNRSATLITAEDGAWLRSQLAAGANITISFPQVGASWGYPEPTGGLISAFSSYGPTFDLYLEPSIAAPGGNILSTIPNNSYSIMSGTSMATPYMAGVGALLFQAKGNSIQVGLAARALFQTTGQALGSTHVDTDPLQTLVAQGGGLVDAYKAIHTTTTISPGELLLNDTVYFKPDHKITITNLGDKAETYAIQHVPVGTALTYEADAVTPQPYPVPLSNVSAVATFSKTSVIIEPRQSKSFTVHFAAPSGLDLKTLPVYSGFITVTSTTSSLKVPYVGALGSLKDRQIFDNSPGYFSFPIPALVNTSQLPQLNNTVYNFSDTGSPSVIFRFAFGTPLFKADLVDANTTFNATYPTVYSKQRSPESPAAGSAAAVATVTELWSIPYLVRNAFYGFTGIRLTNLSDIVPKTGHYKILARALKVTGDPDNEGDYESWLSPEFEIKQ